MSHLKLLGKELLHTPYIHAPIRTHSNKRPFKQANQQIDRQHTSSRHVQYPKKHHAHMMMCFSPLLTFAPHPPAQVTHIRHLALIRPRRAHRVRQFRARRDCRAHPRRVHRHRSRLVITAGRAGSNGKCVTAAWWSYPNFWYSD